MKRSQRGRFRLITPSEQILTTLKEGIVLIQGMVRAEDHIRNAYIKKKVQSQPPTQRPRAQDCWRRIPEPHQQRIDHRLGPSRSFDTLLEKI